MDCVKNLTSCAGCTRKHARCHWRDVTRDELESLDMSMEGTYGLGNDGDGYSYTNGHDESDDDDSNPLEDLEALEEQEEGLRNARELSRMGWEEGIKSSVTSGGEAQEEHPPATTNGETTEKHQHGSPQAVSPRTHQHPANVTSLGAEQQVSAPVANPHRLDTANASPGAAKYVSPVAAPPAALEDYRPSFGGFRAVNGGGTVGGWRE